MCIMPSLYVWIICLLSIFSLVPTFQGTPQWQINLSVIKGCRQLSLFCCCVAVVEKDHNTGRTLLRNCPVAVSNILNKVFASSQSQEAVHHVASLPLLVAALTKPASRFLSYIHKAKWRCDCDACTGCHTYCVV